ncbi:hypothetical protein SAY87_000434 [Trapa incisa]|uniref:Uncharacterized protein n=1 Tax=Trapa incisa TaxID=236973 RepID=A0AAN7JH60_9MYRT|nr:hypothetical protein SAY87_000434 [Trapa incisa]
MAILDVFINFIQERMPHTDVIILTDPASDLYVNRRGVSLYPIQVLGTHAGITRQIPFLWKVLEVFSSKYMSASLMLEDQLALLHGLLLWSLHLMRRDTSDQNLSWKILVVLAFSFCHEQYTIGPFGKVQRTHQISSKNGFKTKLEPSQNSHVAPQEAYPIVHTQYSPATAIKVYR